MTEQEEVAILRSMLRRLEEPREKTAEDGTTLKDRLMAKIDKDGAKWNWHGSVNSDGYPKIKDDGELRLASHVVLEQHGRSIPAGKVVMHLDNDTKNIAPSNLRVGTQKQNLKMMRDQGRDRPRGVAQEPDVKQASADPFLSCLACLRDEIAHEDR